MPANPPANSDFDETGQRFRAVVVVLAPTLLALAGFLARLGRPAYWLDEAATINESGRPFGELLEYLSHKDVVLGAYYLFMHVWTMGGTGEWWARLPSVIAMTFAVLLVADLARRWWGDPAGLTAGLLMAVSPVASRYAQEARPYAIAIALAVLCTWLLVKAAGDGRRRWWLTYAGCVALLGLVHLVGLLVLVAHPVLLAMMRVRAWKAWLLAMIDGLVLPIALAVLAFVQRDQISWIATPTVLDVGKAYLEIAGGTAFLALLAALAVVGLRGNIESFGLLTWFVVPVLLLALIGLATPMFIPRYVLVCGPALILLAAAGLRELRWWQPLLVAVVAGAVAFPQLAAMRENDGHGADIRAAADVIARDCQPGMAVREGVATLHTLPYYLDRAGCDVEWQATADTGDARLLWLVRPGWMTQTPVVEGFTRTDVVDVPGLQLTRWER